MPQALTRWSNERPHFVLFLNMFCLSYILRRKEGWKSPCPVYKVVTYKTLIFMLSLPFYCVITLTKHFHLDIPKISAKIVKELRDFQ